MNKEFWNKKTVLLTGHTGFKGSWLSLWLKKLNANVIGFSKSIPTNPSLFELAEIENGMTSIFGNVCDYKKLEETIIEHKPEIIIHLAAQAILRESYNNPVETYATNVMGTVNLFEAVRKIDNVRVILNITSDKCYEPNNLSKGYQEEDRLGGYDPYSSSKACSELITASFRSSFFNPNEYEKHGTALASCRAGNVIGGGDWGKDRLIPDIIRGIMNDKTINIRNPNSTRPWQHVLDPLNGYMILIEQLWASGEKFSEGWNFGPSENDQKSVRWIVEKIIEQWPKNIELNFNDEKKLHEENNLRLNCEKAYSKLGWKSKLTLEQGLEWVLEWYKQFELNNDMKNITEQQIDKFEKLM